MINDIIGILLMVQMRWIDKVFSFFKKSSESSLKNEYRNSLSSSEKGARGERLALNYSKKELGYCFVVKNGRHYRGEIDLICLDKACSVFIVPLLKATALMPGVHSISQGKNRYCVVLPWLI